MKKLFLLLLMSISFINVSAQDFLSEEYSLTSSNLGLLCYLDVNYVNGQYIGVMPVPPEGLPTNLYPTGPGMPWYENYLGGSTINVVFHRYLPIDLGSYADGEDVIIEVPANKWVSAYGGITTNPSSGVRRCYYYCILRPQFEYDHFR